MIVYFAHPIDQSNSHDVRLANSIGSMGIVLYNPAPAWTVPIAAQPEPALQAANLAVLRHCDAVVASLDKGIMSIGVGIELVEAHNHGIPTIVHGNLRSSWALSYLGIEQTNDVERVLEWLRGRQTWN